MEEEESESPSDEAVGYQMVEFRADLSKTGGNSAMKLSRMLTIAGAIKRLATTEIWQAEECDRINKRLKADASNQNEIKFRSWNEGNWGHSSWRGWKSSDWVKHAQTPDLRNSASRLRLRHYIEIEISRILLSDSLGSTMHKLE